MKHLRFSRQSLPRCLLPLGLPALFGCSLLVDVDAPQCSTDTDCQNRGAAFAGSVCVEHACQQCSLDTDCQNLGAAFTGTVCVEHTCQLGPKWSCADQTTTAAGTQAAIQAPLTTYSIFDYSPMAGIRVSLCAKIDLMCMIPLHQFDTDETGTALIDLPQGFDGYYQLESDKIEPLLFFRHYPVNDGESIGSVALSPKGALQSLATQLGQTVQSDRGLAVVRILDCQQQAAAGVTVDFVGDMSGTRPYYTTDGQVSSVAQSTDSVAAIAGVFNANRGTLGYKFKIGAKAIAQTEIMVREGYLSFEVVQVGQF
jgi:hypothetical protein